MSYSSTEASVASGQPVELYDFADAFNNHWRYTSAADAVTHLGSLYEPAVCSRKEIEISDNHFKNDLEISLGRNNAFAIQYIAAPPESEITLTVYRLHGTDYIYYWQGVIASVSFDGNGAATVKASPKSSGMQFTGKRRKCQKLCDHALYDSGCGVNRESFKSTGTITTISGTTITSSAFSAKADGYFTAGILIVGNAKRLILSHTTNTITISRPILSAAAGNSFTAYAGCDHLPTTCLNKFDNIYNYGGVEFLPDDNPFGRKRIA